MLQRVLFTEIQVFIYLRLICKFFVAYVTFEWILQILIRSGDRHMSVQTKLICKFFFANITLKGISQIWRINMHKIMCVQKIPGCKFFFTNKTFKLIYHTKNIRFIPYMSSQTGRAFEFFSTITTVKLMFRIWIRFLVQLTFPRIRRHCKFSSTKFKFKWICQIWIWFVERWICFKKRLRELYCKSMTSTDMEWFSGNYRRFTKKSSRKVSSAIYYIEMKLITSLRLGTSLFNLLPEAEEPLISIWKVKFQNTFPTFENLPLEINTRINGINKGRLWKLEWSIKAFDRYKSQAELLYIYKL